MRREPLCVCVYGDRQYRSQRAKTVTTELTVWESAYERRILRGTVYVCTLVLIAFFAFIDLIFSVKFTAAKNTAWVSSILIGILSGNDTPPRLGHAALADSVRLHEIPAEVKGV